MMPWWPCQLHLEWNFALNWETVSCCPSTTSRTNSQSTPLPRVSIHWRRRAHSWWQAAVRSKTRAIWRHRSSGTTTAAVSTGFAEYTIGQAQARLLLQPANATCNCRKEKGIIATTTSTPEPFIAAKNAARKMHHCNATKRIATIDDDDDAPCTYPTAPRPRGTPPLPSTPRTSPPTPAASPPVHRRSLCHHRPAPPPPRYLFAAAR